MLQRDIKEILDSQVHYFNKKQPLIKRDRSHEIDSYAGIVTIITGIRRAGKSTLLHQHMASNQQSENLFLHFDDPRLREFNVDDFYLIEKLTSGETQYHFDEIHQVQDWEKYIRQAVDRQNTIIITGSNASMLSSELATLLTGRHLSYELFPFNFREYCVSEKHAYSPKTAMLYLQEGGFPEFLRIKNREIHRQLLTDIIERDIVARYEVRDRRALQQVTAHLLHNIARPYTLRKIAQNFGIGSVNTVASYLSHLQNAYLFFSINIYDHSYKRQQRNPSKIYAIDTGFVLSNTVKIQEDYGRLLENMIFLNLRRTYKDIYYHKDKYECDFIITDKGQIISCYQVCFELNKNNEKRELEGLKEAMDRYDLQEGYLVTMQLNDKIKYGDKRIILVSADHFLSTPLNPSH